MLGIWTKSGTCPRTGCNHPTWSHSGWFGGKTTTGRRSIYDCRQKGKWWRSGAGNVDPSSSEVWFGEEKYGFRPCVRLRRFSHWYRRTAGNKLPARVNCCHWAFWIYWLLHFLRFHLACHGRDFDFGRFPFKVMWKSRSALCPMEKPFDRSLKGAGFQVLFRSEVPNWEVTTWRQTTEQRPEINVTGWFFIHS